MSPRESSTTTRSTTRRFTRNGGVGTPPVAGSGSNQGTLTQGASCNATMPKWVIRWVRVPTPRLGNRAASAWFPFDPFRAGSVEDGWDPALCQYRTPFQSADKR